MTAHPDSAVAPALTGAIASRAALFATFYCPHENNSLRALEGHLRSGFGLVRPSHPEVDLPTGWYVDQEGDIVLARFTPPNYGSGHDTTALQLAMKAPLDAVSAWDSMRRRLEIVLGDPSALDGIRGYTLVFQAVLEPHVAPYPALDELLPPVRRLDGEPDLRMEPLADADVPGGRLWLLAIPSQGDLRTAATVYLALSPSDAPGEDNNAALVGTVIYGPDAALLLPEVVAHKGYYEMRRYHERRYRERVKALRRATDRLLSDLGQQKVQTDRLDVLAGEYNQLARVAPDLTSLRTSLTTQLHNFDQVRRSLGDNEIASFHRSHLASGLTDVDLVATEAREVLEWAGTATTLAQVRVDKQQERRQARGQTLLGVLAVTLAVPQLIDADTLNDVFRFFGRSDDLAAHSNSSLLLLVRLSFIFAILSLAALYWWYTRWRARSSHRRDQPLK